MRGTTVGGTNLYTTISLANNATTSIYTISCDAGSGGWISGTIKLDASTDYAIPFLCFFSRQLDGTTYHVAAEFGADIPAGLYFTNSGSSVQIFVPDVTLSSGSVTYCVQAAASGTTLPVSVSASSVLGSTTGSAPAAGVIGETKTWATPPSTNLSLSTEADWTNATITVTAGVWLIIASVQVGYTTGAVAGNMGSTVVRLTNSANTVIDNQSAQVTAKTSAAAVTEVRSTVTLCTTVSVSSSTEYKLRVYRVNGVGTGTGAVYNDDTAYSTFKAIRIG
jgi:hypothetical protein